MAKVIWADPALANLKSIVEYISHDSPTYASRFALTVVAAPRRLELFPHSGRIVPEFGRPDVRELIHGAYRIVYQIRGDVCYIVAVAHGSRDILQHIEPGDWVIG